MFPKAKQPLPWDKIGIALAVIAGVAVLGVAIAFWPEAKEGPKFTERFKSHLNQTPPDFASDLICLKGDETSLTAEKGNVIWVEFTTLRDDVIGQNQSGLETWSKKYGPRGFKVITVFAGPIDSKRDVESRYVRSRTKTTVMYDPVGKTIKPYQITKYPYGMLIDRDGKVVFEAYRNMTASALEIDKCLGGGADSPF